LVTGHAFCPGLLPAGRGRLALLSDWRRAFDPGVLAQRAPVRLLALSALRFEQCLLDGGLGLVERDPFAAALKLALVFVVEASRSFRADAHAVHQLLLDYLVDHHV